MLKKENIKVQRKFTERIDGLTASIYRGLIEIGVLPYKAYVTLKAIVKTIYRINVTKKHLLEWTTADEAEKKSKTDLKSMYKNMIVNVIFGILGLILIIIGVAICRSITGTLIVLVSLISLLWIFTPFFMWYISIPNKEKKASEKLNKDELEYVKDIAKRTWEYFSEYMNKENNYLPPDNYQESRREKVIHRTSSTNIGLGLMTIISAYDLKLITLEKTISFLENVMDTIINLDKWNGHLYNWYDTKNLKPLIPRYVSTVDSGNFIRIHVYIKSLFEGEREYTV